MRRLAWLLALSLVVAGGLAWSAPVSQTAPLVREIPPYASLQLLVDYKGGERASVIAIGTGLSPMGLYVYDADGNCVAHDAPTPGSAAVIDANAVVWYPPKSQPYRIELRNLGPLQNTVEIAIR